MTRPDLSWMDAGACVGVRNFTEWPTPYQQAFCVTCPVRTECAAYGANIPVGDHNDAVVFGGLLPKERYNLRKVTERAARKAAA